MARLSPVFFFHALLHLLVLSTLSAQQLSPSQIKTLFRLQRILEYPAGFHGWDNRTNPCYLPPSPSLSIACSGNRVTELSLTGSGARLSPSFSMDTLFTTISRLPSLTVLTLVSLGLWGPLPATVDRLRFLRVLNLSSNHITMEIPTKISSMGSLQSLVLAGNRLNGTVPGLASLPALQEVNLQGNLLGPAFPDLGEGVVSVVLSNNSFRSSIPSAIQRFGKLQRLDLSSNRLFGAVPAFLFSLPGINYLDLSQNLLSGSLPTTLSCAAGLGFVDISGNRLVGSLPKCISSNSTLMVVLDSGNCLSSGDARYQHPNSYCNDGAFAALIPPTAKAGSDEAEKKKKGKLGLVLGIVGGIMGGAMVLGLILVVVVRRARKEEEEAGGLPKLAAGKASFVRASPKLPADARQVMTQPVRLGTLGLMPYHVFSIEELEDATNSFDPSNLIRNGARSQIYRGWLQDGTTVVIRCLKLKQRYSPPSIARFVDTISKLRHQHLVSILGHCIDGDQKSTNSSNCVYLILEQISNGTLRSHLTDGSKHAVLTWPQRVAAVIGVARGIQFLHTITVPGISGNDLNIDNILLDEALTAKISNYNLPMVSTNKSNKGASGNPFVTIEETDVATRDSITQKSNIPSLEDGEREDIYQLGLILLEIIMGKPIRVDSELGALKTQLQRSVGEEQRKLCELTDPNIHGTFAYDSLRTAVEIALKCLSDVPTQRPSIDDILWNLQYSVQVQDGWANSDSFRRLQFFPLATC